MPDKTPTQTIAPYVSGLRTLANLTGSNNIPVAGGQTVGSLGSGAGNILNIVNGIDRGGVAGYGGAALAGANLANNMGANIPYVGPLGAGLGIYNGIKQGGFAGDVSAASNAASLYGGISAASNAAGTGALMGGSAVGAAALPLALFAAMDMAFNKNSQYTPAQENRTLIGNLDRMHAADASGQTAALHQDTGAAEALDTYMTHHFDPRTGNYDQSVQDLFNGTDGRAGLLRGTASPNRYAIGGHMSILDKIRPSFKDVPHFDEGGSYLDYFTPTNSYIQPPDLSDTGDMGNAGNIQSTLNQYQQSNSPQVQNSGFLSNLLGAIPGIGQHLANSTSAQQIGGLGALLGLLGHSNTPAANWNPQAQTPFQGQHVGPGQNQFGNFSVTPRKALPMTGIDWATYGQHPEQNFFSHQPAAAPAAPVVAPPSTQPLAQSGFSPLMLAMAQQHPGLTRKAIGGPMNTGQLGPMMRPPMPNPMNQNGAMPAPVGMMNSPSPMQPPMQPNMPMMRPEMPMQRPMMPQRPMQPPMMRPPVMGGMNSTMMAHGGDVGASPLLAGSHTGQQYVQGPGDGTSDDINAKLSDGEYIMDAGTVSMLGNGSNKAGAQKLDQLRTRLRKAAGTKLVKGKQFMKSGNPEDYMEDK